MITRILFLIVSMAAVYFGWHLSATLTPHFVHMDAISLAWFWPATIVLWAFITFFAFCALLSIARQFRDEGFALFYTVTRSHNTFSIERGLSGFLAWFVYYILKYIPSFLVGLGVSSACKSLIYFPLFFARLACIAVGLSIFLYACSVIVIHAMIRKRIPGCYSPDRRRPFAVSDSYDQMPPHGKWYVRI